MANSIHFICKHNEHVNRLDGTNYTTGFWGVSESDASALVGGMVFLHKTKQELSYFGGKVLSWRTASAEDHPDHVGDIIFTIESTLDGRGEKWSGKGHSMAWTSGVIAR